MKNKFLTTFLAKGTSDSGRGRNNHRLGRHQKTITLETLTK